MSKIQIKLADETETPIYKWCGLFFEYFTADRKNYICYEYKWSDLYVHSLKDFSLTPVPDTNHWFIMEGGAIGGEVGSEVAYFANDDLEKRFEELSESDVGKYLYPDEIAWNVVQDYPEPLEDYVYWLKLDPDHKQMIDVFSPYIVKGGES